MADEQMPAISSKLEIVAYIHCGKCLDSLPLNTSPRDWASLEVGYTPNGLQVWCKRHEVNVINMVPDWKEQRFRTNTHTTLGSPPDES